MPTDILRLGPFVGGLNNASDSSAIADAELVDCVNMELDTDGSLVSRPPIADFTDLSGTWTERILLLGVGVFSSGNYIIGSNTNGVYQFSGGTWNVITNTFQASCMVQYADMVWLIAKPGSANPGGKWDPVGGFVAAANMPKGSAAVVFKERLFVVPGKSATTDTSRLVFSEPANFEDYDPTAGSQAAPGVDFIDIAKGDGQKLIDLIVYRGNLLLFKEDATYVLAYETSPTDAVVENISITVGATDQRCVVAYENTVYVYHEGSIFEIVNYDFNKINVKCPFLYDGFVPPGTTRSEPVFMSILGDRLFVRYFNRMYIYGLRTRVWSRWDSASTQIIQNVGPFVAMPSNVVSSVNNEYYAGSALLQNKKVFRFRDGWDATTVETASGVTFDVTCSITTKNYDIAASHLFKRLFWWGADVLANRTVTGTATPIVFGSQVLWGDLFNGNYTWDQLNTWQNPLTSAASVTVSVPTGTGTQRRFLKFLRALRYRQINFKLDIPYNGTTSEGPVHIYTLSLSTKVKQTVGKAVN